MKNILDTIGNVASALIGAALWISLALFLAMQEAGISGSISDICRTFLAEWMPAAFALLLVMDIFIDTYVLGNQCGLLVRSPRTMLFLMCGSVLVYAVMVIFGKQAYANGAEVYTTCALVALSLLYILRVLSYVKVKVAVPIEELDGTWRGFSGGDE